MQALLVHPPKWDPGYATVRMRVTVHIIHIFMQTIVMLTCIIRGIGKPHVHSSPLHSVTTSASSISTFEDFHEWLTPQRRLFTYKKDSVINQCCAKLLHVFIWFILGGDYLGASSGD